MEDIDTLVVVQADREDFYLEHLRLEPAVYFSILITEYFEVEMLNTWLMDNITNYEHLSRMIFCIYDIEEATLFKMVWC